VSPLESTNFADARRTSLSREVASVLDYASAAALAVDEAGQYIYANRAAEDLLGYERLQLSQRHMLDLLDVGPEWYETEFAQFVEQKAWSGNVVLRHATGTRLQTRINAFVGTHRDAGPIYVAFVHPVISMEDETAANALDPAAHGLRHMDIRLLALMAEGFSDKELAVLLGTSVWTVNRKVHEVIQNLGVSSRTEACIFALKQALIA
jgi:PAS domain S-box-containing protein